jgi:hypothetical protein
MHNFYSACHWQVCVACCHLELYSEAIYQYLGIEDNIQMDLKGGGCECDWVKPTSSRLLRIL